MSVAPIRSDTRIIRWKSTVASGVFVAELSDASLSIASLPSTLVDAISDFYGCAFLIVKIKIHDQSAMDAITSAIVKSRLPVRVCLAIESADLPKLRVTGERREKVGLMLDNVDPDTPLSDVANEAIEALRISASFAARSRDHLRSDCILSALLALGHDLGMCALGQTLRTDGDTQFDYVLDANSSR